VTGLVVVLLARPLAQEKQPDPPDIDYGIKSDLSAVVAMDTPAPPGPALPEPLPPPQPPTNRRRWGAPGSTQESEVAIARGLAWLTKQQKADGYWQFDGNAKAETAAATGMVLLSYLATGQNAQGRQVSEGHPRRDHVASEGPEAGRRVQVRPPRCTRTPSPPKLSSSATA